MLCSNGLVQRGLLGELDPSFGAPWFGVEAKGGQDLAGVSLSSLLWVERTTHVAGQNQSQGLLASAVSWDNDNFVHFRGNPMLLSKPEKREEREEWEISLKIRNGNSSSRPCWRPVSMWVTLVDQVKTKKLGNGSLPSKMLISCNRGGWKEWLRSGGKGKGKVSWSQRLWDLAIAPALYVREVWWKHVLKGLFSSASQEFFFFFLNSLLLCPWMPHENFRISWLTERVTEWPDLCSSPQRQSSVNMCLLSGEMGKTLTQYLQGER